MHDSALVLPSSVPGSPLLPIKKPGNLILVYNNNYSLYAGHARFQSLSFRLHSNFYSFSIHRKLRDDPGVSTVEAKQFWHQLT